MNGVYLLHFSRRLHHAGHYLGWADDIERRLEEHRKGQAAKLTAAAVAAGIEFELARVWEGEGRDYERKHKNWKQGPRLCPICKEQLKQARGHTL